MRERRRAQAGRQQAAGSRRRRRRRAIAQAPHQGQLLGVGAVLARAPQLDRLVAAAREHGALGRDGQRSDLRGGVEGAPIGTIGLAGGGRGQGTRRAALTSSRCPLSSWRSLKSAMATADAIAEVGCGRLGRRCGVRSPSRHSRLPGGQGVGTCARTPAAACDRASVTTSGSSSPARAPPAQTPAKPHAAGGPARPPGRSRHPLIACRHQSDRAASLHALQPPASSPDSPPLRPGASSAPHPARTPRLAAWI